MDQPKLQRSLVINEVGAPRCMLCRGGSDFGYRFGAAMVRPGSTEHKGTLDLCAGCIEAVGRVWVDELLRTSQYEELAALLDQLALRMHRQN